MEDLNDKVTGGNLSAPEWNQVPSELQNVIENLGITLSSGDVNQLGKAIAGYVANGTFYTDSGAANAYVLTQIGLKQATPEYTNGMVVEFIPGNNNTGASTINIAGLGVKNITNTSSGGEIKSGLRISLRYNSTSGEFEIYPSSEGLWTPTIQDTSFSNSEGQAYSIQYGSYTKIGSRIFIQGRIQISNLGTLTVGDQAFIAGLPFTSSAVLNSQGMISIGNAGSLNIVSGESVTGTVDLNKKTIALAKWSGTGGTIPLLISELSLDGSLTFAGQYTI